MKHRFAVNRKRAGPAAGRYDQTLVRRHFKERVMARTEKQKMLAGESYDAGDSEIQADLAATRAWLVKYNASLGSTSREAGLGFGRPIQIGRSA